MGGKTMNCQVAEQMIMPYINGTLADDKKEQFFKHILDCPTCYDEFEIYYTMLIVLQKIEEEDDSSYNMKKMLEKTIEDEIRLIFRKKIRRLFRCAVFLLAEAGIAIAAILEISIWMKR